MPEKKLYIYEIVFNNNKKRSWDVGDWVLIHTRDLPSKFGLAGFYNIELGTLLFQEL